MSETGIEFLFHAWWEAVSALTDLVPVERVVTGEIQSESISRPYVCLFVDLAPESRTNSGRTDSGTVLFSIYSDRWQEASEIKDAIKAAFDEQRRVDGNAIITKCRWSDEDDNQNPTTGIWQYDVEFEVTVQITSAGVALPTSGGTLTPSTTANRAEESPSGEIDGENDTFTLSYTPIGHAHLLLFVNGIFQRRGGDYERNGRVITFLSGAIPGEGEWILANYSY